MNLNYTQGVPHKYSVLLQLLCINNPLLLHITGSERETFKSSTLLTSQMEFSILHIPCKSEKLTISYPTGCWLLPQQRVIIETAQAPHIHKRMFIPDIYYLHSQPWYMKPTPSHEARRQITMKWPREKSSEVFSSRAISQQKRDYTSWADWLWWWNYSQQPQYIYSCNYIILSSTMLIPT